MPGVFNGLADVLDTVLRLYLYCLLIAVVLTWVQADPYNPIVRFFLDLFLQRALVENLRLLGH